MKSSLWVYAPMNQSPYPSAAKFSQSEPGSTAPRATNPDRWDGLYRHARNSHGGIDSICQRCEVVIASSADEWSLLACEERHICALRGSQTAALS